MPEAERKGHTLGSFLDLVPLAAESVFERSVFGMLLSGEK